MSNEQQSSDALSELAFRRALKALPREITPERDLWSGIAAQLPARAVAVRPRTAPRWMVHALAAGVACAALVLGWRALPSQQVLQPGATASSGQAPWVLREAQMMKADVDGALVAGTARGGTALDAHADRALGASLKELDSAEAELDQALRLNPDSSFLLDRLRHIQQQKSRLTLRALTA